MTRKSFADRLNRLFETVYPPGQYPYSSAAVVAGVRATGTPMSAPYLSQLRSGRRDNPSAATVEALSKFFRVDPAYLTNEEYADELDEELTASAQARAQRARLPAAEQSVGIAPNNGEYRTIENEPADDVVAPAELDMAAFADRLNALFDALRKTSGAPYSSEEVSSTLQEDGLPITAGMIDRLRAGVGDPPTRTTLDAIAYFFNVSLDSLTDGSDLQETGAPKEATPEETSSRARFDDIGRCVFGLAKSSIRCVEANPPDFDRARQLMALASDLSAVASRSDAEFVDIPGSLRVSLFRTWTSLDAEVILDQAFDNRQARDD